MNFIQTRVYTGPIPTKNKIVKQRSDSVPNFLRIFCVISDIKYTDGLSHYYKLNACSSCGISGCIPSFRISLKSATAVRNYPGTFTHRTFTRLSISIGETDLRTGHESQKKLSTTGILEDGTEIQTF
jgi:hypothetical protein